VLLPPSGGAESDRSHRLSFEPSASAALIESAGLRSPVIPARQAAPKPEIHLHIRERCHRSAADLDLGHHSTNGRMKRHEAGPPMDLANMPRQGVRSLVAYCLNDAPGNPRCRRWPQSFVSSLNSNRGYRRTRPLPLAGGVGALKLAIERGITATAQTGVVQGSVRANIVEQTVT
jgi:hypothetical protein